MLTAALRTARKQLTIATQPLPELAEKVYRTVESWQGRADSTYNAAVPPSRLAAALPARLAGVGTCRQARDSTEPTASLRAAFERRLDVKPSPWKKYVCILGDGSIGRRVDASRGGLGGITALGFCISAASNGDGLASRSRRRGQRRRRWWSAGARASTDGRRARSPSLAR